MPNSHSAETWLQRLQAVYESLESYSDEGDLVSLIICGPARWQRVTRRIAFRTLFVRPDLFRFEMQQRSVGVEAEWPRQVMWADGIRVRTCWTSAGKSETSSHASIADALGAWFGVSAQAAGIVPKLLLPACGLQSPLPLSTTACVREKLERVDGEACIRIDGFQASQAPRTLWIDAAGVSLQRVFHSQELDDDSCAKMVERLRCEIDSKPKGDIARPPLQEALSRFERRRIPDVTVETTIRYQPMLAPLLSRADFLFDPSGQ